MNKCEHKHVEIEFATSDKEDTRVPYVMCKECGEQIRDKQLIKQILSVYS